QAKVIDYMTETIRRMVEDYGADYIKFDYNQDAGIGTDYNCSSPGEGLELCSRAFHNWVKDMVSRFPNVIFEGCASGGMRMDYNTLSAFSLISTSDQTDYIKYPCIAANILSAVIPEQAAVWSYPAGECSAKEITDKRVITNMINSFLGRMHLASRLDLLDEKQFKLVQDGIKVYNELSPIKHSALPYFPDGFTQFGAKGAASGLKYGNKIYLAVWNLDNADIKDISFESNISDAKIIYPKEAEADFCAEENKLKIKFKSEKTALFFAIELK
ncbi:MAG: alpha-galactosidase, partial [Clostridia bacterium]|nr:alpha-galactosidase [Clostridia bacterium]